MNGNRPKKHPSGKYLAKDRYTKQEFLIDLATYHSIMDLIHFYHESIYNLPDSESVLVQKVSNDSKTVDYVRIPMNRIIFE